MKHVLVAARSRDARTIAAATGATALLALAGCSDPPRDPPTAVIRATPSTICQGDAFTTPVTLDGSESATGLTLVPVPPAEGEPPLVFEWSLSGAEYELDVGTLESPEVRVTTAGDRPLHATLTVITLDFGEATSTLSVPITVPTWRPCDGDRCPAGSVCKPAGDQAVCVPDRACEFNADCDVCMRCDIATGACVPQDGAL
jgi:hypothetical protein